MTIFHPVWHHNSWYLPGDTYCLMFFLLLLFEPSWHDTTNSFLFLCFVTTCINQERVLINTEKYSLHGLCEKLCDIWQWVLVDRSGAWGKWEDRIRWICHDSLTYYAPAPVGEAGALGGHRRLSSVCLSDVAYIGSNSKTKRLRKTKLCTRVPQVTCDSHTDFKVKRSKVKVGRGHIVAAT